MAYTIQRQLDEPIIIDTHTDPMEAAGYASFAHELADHAASIDGTIYRIADLRGMKFSFPLLVHVLAEEARSKQPGTAGDPRVRLVLVAEGEVARLLAESAKQTQYGALDVPVFATLDEALAHVRALVAAG
jgi:hypothetical protein